MVKYLYDRIVSSMWFDKQSQSVDFLSPTPTSLFKEALSQELPIQGVLLRQSRGQYVSMPPVLAPSLVATVQRLNVAVAFTMSTNVTNQIFSMFTPNQTEFILPHNSTQYQILESFDDMARATSNKIKRFQYTCFVRKEKVLLLWDDDVEGILTHAADIERQLLAVVSNATYQIYMSR
jgi:hypothetical protein